MRTVYIHMSPEQVQAVIHAHAKFVEPGIWKIPKWLINLGLWAIGRQNGNNLDSTLDR